MTWMSYWGTIDTKSGFLFFLYNDFENLFSAFYKKQTKQKKTNEKLKCKFLLDQKPVPLRYCCPRGWNMKWPAASFPSPVDHTCLEHVGRFAHHCLSLSLLMAGPLFLSLQMPYFS